MTSISAQASSTGGDSRASNRKLMLTSGGLILSFGILLFMVLRSTVFGPPTASDVSHSRTVMDSETSEVIDSFPIKEGTLYPWVNPKSGKATLYPPEMCYWTKDGKAKADPTFVLLNEFTGKQGKTICPDCGREVVGHNPKPPMNLMIEAYKARGPKKQ